MSEDKWGRPQPAIDESSGAKGGKRTLKSGEQLPAGVEPDSEIDEELIRTKGEKPAGLDPNSIVRN